MSVKHDYGCEVIAFVALTVLSALSHFWYILIALCGVVLAVEMARMMFRAFLRVRMMMVSRIFSTRDTLAATEASVARASTLSPLT